jgi:hypothetical protein
MERMGAKRPRRRETVPGNSPFKEVKPFIKNELFIHYRYRRHSKQPAPINIIIPTRNN